MMKNTKERRMRFLYSLILIFFMGTAVYCDKPLKVGVVVNPPFVIKNGYTYTGIAIDLWNELATALGRSYRFIEHSEANMDKPFDSLQKGELDVLVGSLSVTRDRYQKADFTFPFFIDKIIAITLLDYMHNILFFLKLFLLSAGGIIGVFIVFFVVYINLLWYYERSHTKNFPKSYGKGVSYLFWTHILSGRHIEVPKSFPGRILILFQKSVHYFILIVLNATLISFISVTLVKYASPVQCISDLEKEKVGAIKNSKSFKAGTDMGLRMISFESLEDGIVALENGQIEAFLEDLSMAETHLKENEKAKLNISYFELKRDLYAFATQRESPLLRDINIQILKLREKEIPQKICKVYLPKSVKNCDF
jgi:polar amino acid transport system substrate-binding protein